MPSDRTPPQALMRPLVQVLVLTPLSVLGTAVAVLCGALLVRPSADVRLARHWTYLSPSQSGVIGLCIALLTSSLFFSFFALLTASSLRAGRAREEVARAIGLMPALGYASVGAASLSWSLGVAGPNHASRGALTFAAAVSWSSAVLLLLGVVRTYFLHSHTGTGSDYNAPLRPSFAGHPIEWACIHLPPRILLAVHAHALAPVLTLIACGHDALSGNSGLEAGTGLANALALGPAIIAGIWVFATQDVAYATTATTIYINILKSRYDPDKARSINGRPIPPFDPGYPPPVKTADVRRAPLEAERPPSVSFSLIGAIIIILTCIAASFVGGELARGTCGPNRNRRTNESAPSDPPQDAAAVHSDDPERQPLLGDQAGSSSSSAPSNGALDEALPKDPSPAPKNGKAGKVSPPPANVDPSPAH